MTPQEMDQRIRNIARLFKVGDLNDWEKADELAAFSGIEYELALPRLMARTRETRQMLTGYRTTGIQWPKEERLPDVPYSLHYRFRYNKEELKRQQETGTLGQVAPQKKQRIKTEHELTLAVRSLVEILDEPSVPDKDFRKVARTVLGKYRYLARKAA